MLLANVAVLSAAYDYSTSPQTTNSQYENPTPSPMNPNPNMMNSPSWNQNPTTPANPNTTTFQPKMRTSLNVDEDSSVLNNIRNNLANYQGVSVSVYRGDVTLRGTIASQQEKDRIEREIKRISGVRTVDNQIQVVSPSRG